MVDLRDAEGLAFPRTRAALRNAELAPRRRAVARQRAGKAIHTHSDRVPWCLTCHVALEGPPGGAAYMIVDGERLDWTPGAATVCDTTFFHSAHNDHAEQDMHLLHLEVFHPDLREDERRALRVLHNYLGDARERRADALSPFVAGLENAFLLDP